MTAEHEAPHGAGSTGNAGSPGSAGGAANAGSAGGRGESGRHGDHEHREQHGEYGKHGDFGDSGEFGEYDGMDALMAAITGDPLPEEARRDPVFLAGHRAAEADVAVLRDRLAWLAEALTGDERGEPAERSVTRDAASRNAVTGDAAAGSAVTGDAAAGSAVTGDAAAGGAVAEGVVTGDEVAGGTAADDGVGAAPSARRSRSRTRPAGSVRPAASLRPSGSVRSSRAGRTRGSGRALRIALGSLAGAAAFSLALGVGWLVTNGGVGGENGGSAKSAADAAGKEVRTAVRPADPERELACSPLVVEGTVTRVQRREEDSSSRVTVTVSRSYRPTHGPAEVGFLVDGGMRPVPRTGQHVLVVVGRGERYASRWAVGDARVAAERAWITDALPGARNLACPSGEAP
ncbi:hypothetical protein [Streptomyces echinatus]|uniref:hypothetical protein n=1 Tax=Streptomyces echinatus TaxID=67293 RepID=UPI0037B87A6E